MVGIKTAVLGSQLLVNTCRSTVKVIIQFSANSMIETSSVPPRKSSAISGKFSEYVRKRSSSLRNNFGKSSESGRKSSDNREKRRY